MPNDKAVVQMTLELESEGTGGWRVRVFAGPLLVATAIENTCYEAAVVGAGLYFRAMKARDSAER